MSLAFRATVDVRTIAPQDRHPVIFSTFRRLGPGETMEIVNDHDPLPLQRQFQLQAPGAFGWDYVEAGPATWRVAITRLGEATPVPSGGCCGGCCGGA
ncbi:MAG TPA: DUF2249 domain-containing protein [Gemmatimonadales bacterium]|nr:DUF2249 domain-containing protein [Gemmatimonadales bacterium]